ncbi:MAG: hypothetical protein K2H81_03105, partial [Alistipes sp.]|nr:hypothetical protein [Alistipes sp.]
RRAGTAVPARFRILRCPAGGAVRREKRGDFSAASIFFTEKRRFFGWGSRLFSIFVSQYVFFII